MAQISEQAASVAATLLKDFAEYLQLLDYWPKDFEAELHAFLTERETTHARHINL